MAHEIATTNGKPAMAYFGQTPWHRLGTQLDAPATADQAIQAAGLDYEVTLMPLTTTDGQALPNRRAVIRADTRDVLGIVSGFFVPLQNREAFAFLDAVVAEGSLRYHTAGALGKGERIWLLAKLPEQIHIFGGEDLVDEYLLLSNAHDGSAALRVFFTPIRVVCANTLAIAHRLGTGKGISIRHRGDLTTKLRQTREVLGLARRFFDDAASQMDRLARYFPTFSQLTGYFERIYPDPEEGKDNTHAVKTRAELQRLFEEGIGHDRRGVRGTAWAAYNAVTQFVDHNRNRSVGSIWFGAGAKMKRQAWDLAVAMAEVN